MAPSAKEHPRIVSLVPSWTETLFAFGLDQAVVGCTTWCVHPRELTARVTKVGGTKDPRIPEVVALKPDLVVANHEENRKEDVEALERAGLHVWTSDVRTIDDSLRDILELGRLTGREDAATALVDRIRSSLDEVAAARPPAAVPVYVPIWRRPWMTLTRDTYAHALLDAAGAHNVFGTVEGRYPERSPEEARAAGATAALLPSEPYPFAEKHKADLVEAGFDPARVALLDGEALTWYGAREVEGIREVARVVRELRRAMPR